MMESMKGESPKPRKRTTVDGGVWRMVLVRRSKIGLLMHCGGYSVGYQRLRSKTFSKGEVKVASKSLA